MAHRPTHFSLYCCTKLSLGLGELPSTKGSVNTPQYHMVGHHTLVVIEGTFTDEDYAVVSRGCFFEDFGLDSQNIGVHGRSYTSDG